jgi:valyl-tRNA synthetase
MPFVTEALWQELPHAGDSVIVAQWPVAGERDEPAEADFGALIELVRAIRNARTEANVEPGRWIAARVYAGERATAFAGARRELSWLARIADEHMTSASGSPETGPGALTVVAGDVVAILPLAGLVDLDAERERLRREVAEADAERTRAERQLANESFLAKAPPAVVEVQRKRLATAEEQIALLRRRLADLED